MSKYRVTKFETDLNDIRRDLRMLVARDDAINPVDLLTLIDRLIGALQDKDPTP